MNPTVSVCVPTYNRASTLSQTIRAVLEQTFSDWELIICDDASSDGTEQVVRAFGDSRIYYHRNEKNLGLYPNWNHCVELASGKYIAIYHDHDLYLPTILERSVALLEKYSMASFVHTALLLIDAANNPVGVDIRPFPELMPGRKMKRLLATSWASPIMAATAMVRREAYEQVGPYHYQRYGLGCDMDMWFRLCQIGDVAYIRDPQVFIRARTKGEKTAQFHWSEVTRNLHMHRDHLAQEFEMNRLDYYLNRAQYVFQRDKRLLMYGIRAVLLESPEVNHEGDAVIQSEASLYVKLLLKMAKRSTFLRSLLRYLALPSHRCKVSRLLNSHSQEARDYLESNDYLSNYLSMLNV